MEKNESFVNIIRRYKCLFASKVCVAYVSHVILTHELKLFNLNPKHA